VNNACVLVGAVAALVAGAALAQDQDIPLKNWTAPPYWRATVIVAKPGPEGQMQASEEGMTAQAQSLPSSPLPFVAITPCRIVDTRVNVADGFHEPNFSDDETRTFDLPNSPDCTGLPSTAGAWSLNVQFRPISTASYITLFPTGTTRPLVSTTVATPAGFTTDAAIVPAGTSGDIDVYCQYAGRVVIDINGYYASQSLVSSLNTKTGDLTLAAGSNIAITPSTNTLTIAMTGVPGGTLPAGSAGQTLYSNGSGWLASSALTNDGSNVGVNGNLLLPNSTGPTGVIVVGGHPFLHSYAGPGTSGGNTFLGQQAGNFTMGGALNQGCYNVGVGLQSLTADTTGSANTATGALSLFATTSGGGNSAFGYDTLFANTSGSQNTAIGMNSLFASTTGSNNATLGAWSMFHNTLGPDNAALGAYSLFSNTTGPDNAALGVYSLYSNTTGSYNAALGAYSLYSNTTGSDNTALGASSLLSNATAPYNTGVGYQSLSGNTTGFSNTGLGANAGYRSDTITGYDNATQITFSPNTTGSWNTFLGEGTGAIAPDVQNCTAVGVDAYCTASNQVRLGNRFVASIGGEVAWSALSDARAKTDIHDLDLGLDLVMKLRPVSYRLRSGNGKTDMGFVAQDIEALLGDGYNVLDIGGDPERTLSLRHTDLIAPLVKAVQEQQAQIEWQRTTIAGQQVAIEALTRRLADTDTLQGQLRELQSQVRALMAAKEVAKPVEAIGN
jgi:hypothetical protein